MSVTFVLHRSDWLALATALVRRHEGRLADFVRAGLAFGAPGPDPAAAVALEVPASVAATVRTAAVDLGLELAPVDDQAAAVAAAEAILRAARQSAP